VQQAVVDGAVQQVEGDFEVRLGGDLAAVTGPDEELAGRVAPGLDEVAAVKLGKSRFVCASATRPATTRA
jgi:hypothetical protein